MPGGVNRRWMPTRRARRHRRPLADVRPTPSDATPGTGRPARARRCVAASRHVSGRRRSRIRRTPPRPGRSADQQAAPSSCAVSGQPRWLRCRTCGWADPRSRCQKPLRRGIESRQEWIPDWRVNLDPCLASLAPDGPGMQSAVTRPPRQVAGCGKPGRGSQRRSRRIQAGCFVPVQGHFAGDSALVTCGYQR
jgi:hypothetical protein